MQSRTFTTALLFIAILLAFTSSASAASDSELEEQVADLMKRDRNQQRGSLTRNSILAQIARERAYDMGRRNYFGHVNPDGIGANYLITKAGYELPDFYGNLKSSNNVESIAAGSATATEVWSLWMNSTGHRTHILGLSQFYADQVEYGVGHAFVPGSLYGHYWVIITAKPGKEEANSVGGSQVETGSVSDEECRGKATSHPNVLKASNGNLRPFCGFLWVNGSDPGDLRVRPMPGLIRNGKGNLLPDEGYTWVNRSDPQDYRVRRKRD